MLTDHEALVDEMVDEFLDAYITAALWAETDNADDSGGEPLDKNYDRGDLAHATEVTMIKHCLAFLRQGGATLIAEADKLAEEDEWSLPGGADCTVAEYAGHDFWLTRNGHGCGFWDGDWPEQIGDELDKLAKTFGEFNLYVGDDGKIHGA